MPLYPFTTVSIRSELYGISTFQDGRACAVLGHSAAWDSPTEFWTWDSSSSLTDNGTTVIKPTETSGNGRFIFKSYLPKQYGAIYSKEWNGAVTTATNTAVFDISSAGFASIVNLFAFAVLPSGTVVNLPLTTSAVSPTNTSVTVNILESKTTAVLIGGNIEGLENHAVANTVVYLTVRGN